MKTLVLDPVLLQYVVDVPRKQSCARLSW